MAYLVELLRPISGLDAVPGTILDAAEWRNTNLLIQQGRIRPVRDSAPAAPAASLSAPAVAAPTPLTIMPPPAAAPVPAPAVRRPTQRGRPPGKPRQNEGSA